ncbi:MAG: sulfatase [Opitutales bacterium]|nr:sulfatase [Opitutales bacterium]
MRSVFFTLCAFGLTAIFSSVFGKAPNVIFFIADDVSWNDYGCYGNNGARTPNIDALAEKGIRFTNAYLTASSCSPSRASIVTGRYPHNNGKAAELHLPIADRLPWLPEELRELGYYTALSGKNHMKRVQPKDVAPFDHIDNGRSTEKGASRGGEANWVALTRDRPTDKPFFFWFASIDAHRSWDDQWELSEYGPKTRPEDVVVPPFLIDTSGTREDLAFYYNEITRFDYHIGQVVKELERQNALENTLIFVLADNGRPFPRAKTRLHDSGMKTALVAHWPDGIRSPGDSSSLVSVIDLAPTVIEAAGGKPGPTFQGLSLSPIFKVRSVTPRRFAFSEHNWHDYEALGRSIRAKGFLYLENDRPELAWQGPADSVRSVSHGDLVKARDAGSLNSAQQDVFLAPRPKVELYDVTKDPHQLKNLAGDPEYSKIQNQLAKLLMRWRTETGDSVPERISVDEFGRESGERVVKGDVFRGETPGESNEAWNIDRSGPR